ncbi:hypothetical protein ASG56_18680 [Rhodococcus sp. Leaf7]|uniref:cell division protein ZapE n=1 Tax=unclassified Rhodococcus (in: high G+C Gram-positive bacteria) TaxID=192944 RepID=UPI0007014F9F|nr:MULTISPECIES: cell division protein ZapE [unclassified Rhodococcus (in: high G+C Gram-positive bacteria)]KQU02875.1 hypothetical protein ASG56_18680 [Rhodococcus sp. Leaf7]KQU38674.1 hypothetical protein ASG64_16165 [Rhodococcus sp. Leaf247]
MYQLAAADALEQLRHCGVYLWGPPGRGKTWLMDTYSALASTDRKVRTHFHSFLADLHTVLHKNGHDLAAALDRLVGDVDVLCFDELHVHDPADAIFVSRLLTALFERSTVVVATSNYPPSGLLPNPLFHGMFEPAIRLIERSMSVVCVDGPIDYRTVDPTSTRTGFAAGRWIILREPDPSGLKSPEPREAERLTIGGRTVEALAVRADLVWFTFDSLCVRPHAPTDFLALAERFPRWVIDGIPGPSRLGRDAAHRFGSLVDVLYDASIRTDFLADVPLKEFLGSRHLPIDASRMASRLGSVIRSDAGAQGSR